GNTKDEILGMLQSAKEKRLGSPGTASIEYDPGEDGPVALGCTKEGLFAFLDRQRQIIVAYSANQLLDGRSVLALAPSAFWRERFPTEKAPFHAYRAGEALIVACRNKGPFNPQLVR